MKNTKRILAVVIALTMVIGMFASVSAASKKWYSDAVTYLEQIGIAKIGTKAETKLTRAEFVLWVAKLEAGQYFVDSNKWKEDGLANVIVFSDVDTSVDGIYRSAINYCYQRKFVRGNGDGTFSPDAKVTLAQASAVIVRLMGYDNKVTNLEDWQYNYFNVANNYCNAFDATFAANLPAVDAEYELTYGEAAYLLATILNWGAAPQDPTAIAQLPCLTSEGENLGEKFPRGTFSASSQVAIVTGVEHVAVYYDLYGGTGKIYGDNGEFNGYTSEGSTLNYNFKSGDLATYWANWGFDADTKTLDFVTNVIDPNSYVMLNLVDEDGSITNVVALSVSKLQQLVRVSLGKSKNVDVANGEVFNLGDYIDNGSVVGIELSAGAQAVDVKSVSVATEAAGTRLVSNTFLVLTSTGEKWVRNLDGSIARYGKYPYLANAEGSFSNTPALPASYTDAKKVSVSGSKLTLGETTYTIVSTRSVGANEIVVYDAYDDILAPLSAGEVSAMLPNTAKGEHDVEFTDVDGDGYFDIAVIRDYSYFKYVDKTNADPSSSTSGAKYNQGGAVVIDKKVTTSANSDSWKYDSSSTGKIQLVVQASNKNNAIRTQYYGNTVDVNGNTVVAPTYPMQYYKVVDIANLTTAYIESVEKDLVTVGEKTYYAATLVNVADGTKNSVLIPTSTEYVDEYTNVTIEIAGQSTSVKVYSADWMTFLAKEEAAREAGIDQAVNEAGTGAWLVDRTVKYATKGVVSGAKGQAADMVCVMLDTTSTATTGFIVNIAKTETGDNTYNVTIAKSGAINDNEWVSAVDAYWTSMRWGGWWSITTYGNGGAYAFSGASVLPVFPGVAYNYQNATVYSRTARQFLTSMGFTDVDAWANNLNGWQARNGLQGNTNAPFARMGNIWAYARNAVKAAGSADVLDMTLAEIKTAYPSVAGNMDNLVTNYNYILVNDLKGTGIDDSITLRSVFSHNVWTGFNADTFAANVLNNVENVASNQMYGYFLIHISDIIASGYLNTSKTKMGNDASASGYFTSVTSAKGAKSVGTYEVRASASSIWDWDNYSVYYGIFAGQTLKEHEGSNTNVKGELSYNSTSDADVMAKKATYDAKVAALAAAENAVVTAQNNVTTKQEELTAAQEALTAAQTAAAADPTNEELAAAVETAQGAVETAQGAVTTAQGALADAQAAVEPAQAELDEAATAYFAVAEFTASVTGQDLTYVSVMQDGANTKYVLQYLDESTSIYANASKGWAKFYTSGNSAFGSAGNAKGTMAYYKEVSNEASFWNQYQSGIILTDVSAALAAITIPDGQTETQTELTVRVATDPYYRKIYNGRGEVSTFERHWVVGEYTVTVTSKYASGDPQKTYIPVVDFNGVQIKVTTQAEKDEWEKQTTVDVNGVISTYEVNSQGYLFKVNTRIPEFKYDANGKKVIQHTYDFNNMVAVQGSVPADVVADEDEIVGLIGIEEMTDRKEVGYFPGAYKVIYDGNTYIAAGTAPVVIMTPNFKTGDLDGTATTVEGLAAAKAEVFVTYAQVAGLTSPDGSKSLDMISVIGELVDKTAQPQTPEEEKTYLVYLAQEGVTIEALELGKYFVVRSTYSASLIPSCEDFGSIYRKYSTYTEAKYAAEVDVAIGTGYYSVKEDGEIVKAAGATKSGEITEVDAAGNIKATMDGKKVDATNYKWTFIYEDFEGNLHVAGSSTKVQIASKADVLKTLDSAKKALATAEADYAQAQALKLSAEMQATLKGVVDEKAAALETAKQNAVTKYLDGQFWGTASSPVYNYVNSYKYTYQKEPAPVTFQYTVIDGTYVVFVSSFFA